MKEKEEARKEINLIFNACLFILRANEPDMEEALSRWNKKFEIMANEVE